MDRDLRKIIGISAIVLAFGGIGALVNLWSGVVQIFIAFFPFFAEVGKMAIEDYLTSPYFIVSVIMTIASCFGIWFGKTGGKILYLIVSIITLLISIVSIGSNIL